VGEVSSFIETQSIPSAGAILNSLSPAIASQSLEKFQPDFFTKVVPQLDANHAAQLISSLDEKAKEEKLKLLDEATAKEIRMILSYPIDKAGHFMDPKILTFRPETPVQEALDRIQQQKKRRIYDLFLVDETRHLVGVVSLQDLLAASETLELSSLVKRQPITIQALAPAEEAIDLFQTARLNTLPVVDYDGRLLGVIRQRAIMRATEQEASLDIQSMVGVSKEERALSKIGFAVRKRLPWLHINLLTAFLAAAIVGIFEGTIAKFTALAVLLPVVAGQSGNSGAQALAVTMRGLSLREVRVRQWPRLIFKEAGVGMANGLAVALTTSLGVYIWSRSLGLSLVIGSAMVLSMIAAGLAGAMIPVLLTIAGQDPAQAASIILTTVTDIVGFLSFLGLATLFAGFL
jgi:magnesium transporter